MHNQAKRSIRLVLISVASLDGMLKSITWLSSSIKFAGYTHLIFTWVRRARDSVRVKCQLPKNRQRNDSGQARLTPDHLHHDQFELLKFNIYFFFHIFIYTAKVVTNTVHKSTYIHLLTLRHVTQFTFITCKCLMLHCLLTVHYVTYL